MAVNKNGIKIYDGTFRKKSQQKVQVDRYVEMRHIVQSYKSIVTPFDKNYIKQLKKEGYRLVDDFRVQVVV